MTDSPDRTGRHRRFQARHRQLLDTALRIAEAEGWGAVTTRRLAEAIDYSQPVVYQHFKNRDELIRTVVVEGFVALTGLVEDVAGSAGTGTLEDVCRAYLDFGTTRPRLYEAMFARPTSLPFAEEDTPPEVRGAFEALAAVIAGERPGAARDSEATAQAETAAAAELLWACCHGLVALLNAGRIPPDRLEHHVRRVAEMTRQER